MEQKLSDIKVSGSGQIGGGKYNEVKISGSAKINGDVECNEYKCSGSSTATGNVKAKTVGISGSTKIEGNLDTEKITISGSSNILGNIIAKEVKITGSNIFELLSQNGEYYLTCVDMFGETLSFNLNNSYRLPFDYLPSDDDFDIINLTDNEYVESTENPLENTSQIIDDLSKTSESYTRPFNEVNEFGPLTSLDIDSKKILPNVEALANEISREKIFEEMITPPESSYGKESYKGTILDITSIGKRNAADKNPIGDENLTPDRLE